MIDWIKSAVEVHNFVRGLSPIPAAFFIYDGKVIKVYRTQVVSGINLKPFQFHQAKTELVVGCGKGSIRILEIQQEGKKRMNIEEFLRGFRI